MNQFFKGRRLTKLLAEQTAIFGRCTALELHTISDIILEAALPKIKTKQNKTKTKPNKMFKFAQWQCKVNYTWNSTFNH